MQASMFNVRVPLDQAGQGDDVFLMNTFTDAQLIVSRDVAALLDRLGSDAVTLKPEEREALATLSEQGFIVDDRESERRHIEQFFRDFRESTDQLRVTVLTTLQCNFACDYCFQGDHGDYNKIRREDDAGDGRARGRVDGGAARRAEAGELRADALWRRAAAQPAGGVLPGRTALESSQARGVRMVVNVITNGLLLTPDVVDRLAPFGLNAVKVTLDGDHDTHNRMRPLRGGQGTFDKIIENVRRVAGKVPHLHRRQLRRDLGRQLSRAARFPARAGVRRQAGPGRVQADHPRAEAAAAQGPHPAHRRRHREASR